MNYKYIAENSEVCKDLEERMRKFGEYFVIHHSAGSSLVVSDSKIGAEINKLDSSTHIEPDKLGKIEKVAMKNPRDEKSRIIQADLESVSAMMGNSVYIIRYNP